MQTSLSPLPIVWLGVCGVVCSALCVVLGIAGIRLSCSLHTVWLDDEGSGLLFTASSST